MAFGTTVSPKHSALRTPLSGAVKELGERRLLRDTGRACLIGIPTRRHWNEMKLCNPFTQVELVMCRVRFARVFCPWLRLGEI